MVGVEFVERMGKPEWDDRGETRLDGLDPSQVKGTKEGDFMVAVTTMQRRLVPKEYGLGEGGRRRCGCWRLRMIRGL